MMPSHHNCPLLVTLPSETSDRLNSNVSWGHAGAFSKSISHFRGMARLKHWGKHFGMHRFEACGQNWRWPVPKEWFCLLSLWQLRAQNCSFAQDFCPCCQCLGDWPGLWWFSCSLQWILTVPQALRASTPWWDSDATVWENVLNTF